MKTYESVKSDSLVSSSLWRQPIFSYSRLILLSWPLHYKRTVTKKRIHVGILSIFTIFANTLAFTFICFRQDGFIEQKDCTIVYVLQELAYMTVPFLIFIIFSFLIVICHCIVTFKLIKRAKLFGTNNADVTSKLMRASWIVSSSYIVLYIPSAVMLLTDLFIADSRTLHVLILQDICALILFLNNIVNPFIYYVILKDFRAAYISFLTCGKRDEW